MFVTFIMAMPTDELAHWMVLWLPIIDIFLTPCTTKSILRYSNTTLEQEEVEHLR